MRKQNAHGIKEQLQNVQDLEVLPGVLQQPCKCLEHLRGARTSKRYVLLHMLHQLLEHNACSKRSLETYGHMMWRGQKKANNTECHNHMRTAGWILPSSFRTSSRSRRSCAASTMSFPGCAFCTCNRQAIITANHQES